MPAYTYIGPEPSITFRGILFPHGEPVSIEDMDLARKLARLDMFDGPPVAEESKPEAKPAADNALQAENAELKKRLQSLQFAYDELNTRFSNLEDEHYGLGDEEVPDDYVPTEEQPEEPAVPEIGSGLVPDNWREMHWKQRVRMAKDFTDRDDIETAEQADAIIEGLLKAE
jgi:hypothetical protein